MCVKMELFLHHIIMVEFLDALLRWPTLYWSGFLDARAVFRIVVEKVDILIAINFYLHSNLTVQMARLVDSRPCH